MRNEFVSEEERNRFDEILEALIPSLPPRVRQVMEEVPIVVEDAPDEATMRKMKIKHPAGLLGLYHGVSIDRRSLNDAPRLGDVVYLYRLGLLSVARRRDGILHEIRLREEIRKTILHEIGHYHGMDEEELEDLGY
jgi:predicted Zn-dependent protease with MMP-like domain